MIAFDRPTRLNILTRK